LTTSVRAKRPHIRVSFIVPDIGQGGLPSSNCEWDGAAHLSWKSFSCAVQKG
jgi:hypothetical protein